MFGVGMLGCRGPGAPAKSAAGAEAEPTPAPAGRGAATWDPLAESSRPKKGLQRWRERLESDGDNKQRQQQKKEK